MAQRRAPGFLSAEADAEASSESGAFVPRHAPRVKPGPHEVGARIPSPSPLHLHLEARPSVSLARGLLSEFWDQGYPDPSAYGPVRLSIKTSRTKPSRGPPPHEADYVKTS